MADEITLEVSGLSELDDMLSELPARMAKQIFGHALKAAGAVVLKDMRARCPVLTKDAGPFSNSLPAGALLQDLSAKVSLYPQNNAGVCRVGPSDRTAYVAVWLEYGHLLMSHGKKGKRKEIKHIAAKPFMRQAADATAQAAVDVFGAELAAGLDELAEGTGAGVAA